MWLLAQLHMPHPQLVARVQCSSLIGRRQNAQNDTRRCYVYCCYDTQRTITSITSLLLLLLLMLILAFLPLFASIG